MEIFDPTDGPKIVAFLDFVQELYFLANLVDTAAQEGDVKLNFGDLVLAGKTYFTDTYPDIIDNVIEVGGNSDSTDLRKAMNLNGRSLPDPGSLPSPTLNTPDVPPATKTFTSGVQKPGGAG